MSQAATISDLEKVLKEEIQLYEQYADLLTGDGELMSKLKVDDLEASNKSKATLLMKIQSVDQMRQRVVAEIAQEKGISAERVKVTDICEKLTKEDGDRLLALRDRLHILLGKIREIHESATSFVQTSTAWIEGSMSTLRRLLTPSGTYNQTGRVGRKNAFSGHVVENKA